MKNLRNLVLLFSSVLLLGACGGGEDNASQEAKDVDISERYNLDKNTPAWQLDNKEEVTELTWYVNADWWNDEWGNDVVTKKMEEDLNIKVKFIKGDDTNLNTMFSSNDMADIVTIFDSNSQVAQKADSWAYSLDELADKYDPYWQTVAAKDTLNWFQLDDGKTYGYPNYSNTAEDYDSGLIPANTNFLIRKDVYKAIGENNFETADDFIAGMKSIKEKYPELVPFGFNALGDGAGSLGDVFQDYLGVDLETKEGNFYNRNLDQEYLNWLKVLRQIHEDGNLSDDSFSDDGTAFEEKVKSGQYATIMASGTAQMSGFLQSWLAENPNGEYIAINGPQNSEGKEPKLNQSGITGWMINYISKSAKDPAKAMQIFTYLQSEYGGILTTFGIDGETFQYDNDGKIELLPEVQEMKDNDSDRFKKEYRLSEFIFFGHDKYQSMASESTQTPALIQPREWGEGKLYPHFILENIDPSSGTQEARNLSAINTNWYTTLVCLIRSSSEEEFDQVISSYSTFLDQNGWSDIEAIRNEKIAENKEKLGIE